MKSILSRWFMFGLLVGWALSHATVFGQSGGNAAEKKGVAGTAVEKLRHGLDKKVTIDFNGQSLSEALNHLRDKTGLPINIDQPALLMSGMNIDVPMGQVEIKAKDEKASSVLRKFLNTYRLTYIIFEDALLITTEETAVMRQFRQRVNVDVEGVPFKKAARDLAGNQGINLVIDPAVMKQADAQVSLQVENTGVETAVRLLAEMASLKAVRMGNVMFITNEEKAKKIRKEEKDQFDNPLNPNVPGMQPGFGPAAGFGGMMGGIGGIARPVRVPPPPIQKVLPPQAEPTLPPPGVAPPVNRGTPPVAPPPLPPRLEAPPGAPTPIRRPDPTDR
jgi:type II secretory pathway component GspD/PulD (secretin)